MADAATSMSTGSPPRMEGRQTNCYLVQGDRFEVDKRYKILEPVCHGSYGLVCAATDTVSHEKVAVRKVENVFEGISTSKRALREIRILRHLQHENVLMLRSIFVTHSRADFDEIYMVTDLMESDLAQTIASKQALSFAHIQYFLYQILRGMKYVHSAGVVHRDLKPRNLLVNRDCDLKICDFGVARVQFGSDGWVCPMTEYACTRWYRAPEVLCSWANYTSAVDVWSIGCILAEMHTRAPLCPGQNTQNQLDLIVQYLGTPTLELLSQNLLNRKCRAYIQAMPVISRKDLDEVHAGSEMAETGKQLLTLMLRWDPADRITVCDAIEHPYVEALHCPEDEPAREPLDLADFEFERRRVPAAVLRDELFDQVAFYEPQSGKPEGDVRRDMTLYRPLAPGDEDLLSSEGLQEDEYEDVDKDD